MLPRIDLPTFEVEVPSTKAKIRMRPMRVREEKILLMAKEGADPAEILGSVKQIVNNCIVGTVTNPADKENAIDIDNLALFDLEYLFIQLRSHSVSETAEVSYLDNDEIATAMEGVDATAKDYQERLGMAQRKATRTFTVKLNDVSIKWPENTEKTVKVTDKVGIVLRYPPAKLYGDKEFLHSTGEELIDKLIAHSVETIYDGKVVQEGDKLDKAEIKEFIDNLEVKVYNKVKEFFSDLPHLYYKIEYKNKNGKDRTIELTTLNDFFSLA